MTTSDELRPDWLTEPRGDRFDASTPGYRAAMTAHRRAVETGEPGYLDPDSGLFVMTAVFLRDRGWCCDCGCRHCPYLRSMNSPGGRSSSPASGPDFGAKTGENDRG